MIKLDPPLFDVADLLPKCLASYEDPQKQARLTAISSELTKRERKYNEKGSIQELYTIQQELSILDVTKEELIDLYESKLVKHKHARSYYDAMRSAPANGICPICGFGSVRTLDHYLPKAKHPSLSITPLNLVPACFDCNHTKLADAGNSLEKQTLHPYFDDLRETRWLIASLIERDPPAVTYKIVDSLPPNCAVSLGRIQHHFNSFSLGRLYASNAASALSAISGSLTKWASRGGTAKVKEYLETEAESALANNPNDWRGAMYEALAQSDWFCSGGYKLIKKIENTAASVEEEPASEEL